MKMDHPSYNNLNSLLASAMSNITCGLRFPGQINGGLRKQAVNMIPFPRLHFFMNTLSPLLSL